MPGEGLVGRHINGETACPGAPAAVEQDWVRHFHSLYLLLQVTPAMHAMGTKIFCASRTVSVKDVFACK